MSDNTASAPTMLLPPLYAIRGRIAGNEIHQLLRPREGYSVCGPSPNDAAVRVLRSSSGQEAISIPVGHRIERGAEYVVRGVDDRSAGSSVQAPEWIRPRPIRIGDLAEPERLAICRAVRESWSRRFHFVGADPRITDRPTGLRPPQVGAVHAVAAHWRTSDSPATVVLPTGTGKTETMLALLVSERLERLLVVVPTDALRSQMVRKFSELGLLKQMGLLDPEAQYPIVGILKHKLDTVDDAEAYFRACNVVITTMQVVSQCSGAVQQRIAELTSHLFVDEAHHVRAETWDGFRERFRARRIVQFTATPYRRDGQPVDGEIVFDYPLSRAQAESYFRPIRFRSIDEPLRSLADEHLATVAIAQLNDDLAAGRDHILLARVRSIRRAEAVHRLYETMASEHAPVLVHSKVPRTERKERMERIQDRSSRVVVCVDMFGEGFDLPALKVASLHDIHKSLAVTLQFIGRFTRPDPRIGDATVIANIADPRVESSLSALYAESPDWSRLIASLSEGAVGRAAEEAAVLAGFEEAVGGLPLRNLLPKMSTMVFRTRCAAWNPDGWENVFPKDLLVGPPRVNLDRDILVFVTRHEMPVQWGNFKGLLDRFFHLYLVHWDKERGLLYIHSSDHDDSHAALARAVAGADTRLIRDERVFCALGGMRRLVVQNLGISSAFNNAIRHSSHSGADVAEGLAPSALLDKVKTNLFARGFEDGERVSVGVSRKGRIWAHRVAKSIGEWMEWCYTVGDKLLDPSIRPEDFLEHVMIPEALSSRPSAVPLAIDWPEEFLRRDEEAVHVVIAGQEIPFFDVGLELTAHEEDGPIRFRVWGGGVSAEYEVQFHTGTAKYVPVGTSRLELVTGRRRLPVEELFEREQPPVYFSDGSYLKGSLLYRPRSLRMSFLREHITIWDWTGTDLNVESQTEARLPRSIQARVIRELLGASGDEAWSIVFDDDDHHEAADIVAIRLEEHRVVVHLFHCKYAPRGKVGARSKDLFEVCGQAQRSVHWKTNVQRLIEHLRTREIARLERSRATRFDRGDLRTLSLVSQKAPYLDHCFKVWVVQPGLSAEKAGPDHLDLLGVTEMYLRETRAVAFGVIASP